MARFESFSLADWTRNIALHCQRIGKCFPRCLGITWKHYLSVKINMTYDFMQAFIIHYWLHVHSKNNSNKKSVKWKNLWSITSLRWQGCVSVYLSVYDKREVTLLRWQTTVLIYVAEHSNAISYLFLLSLPFLCAQRNG